MKRLNYILISLVAVIFSSTASAHHKACKIKNQSGTLSIWCSSHHQKGSLRCYADVEYSDGTEGRVWGKTCYDSYADCWGSGIGGVEPDCAES
jgi:hypothetical protein